MINKFAKVLFLASLSLFFAGCSTTHQARSVQKSGFLGNYSQLKPGDDDQALLRYVNPVAEWSKYTKVIVQPVQIYAGTNSDLSKTSPEERQALASYYTAALTEELKKDYTIVNTPGPDVLVVKTAITDADSSMVALNTVTTILPIGLAVSTLKRVVTGSDSFVGDAQSEMEIDDSMTGQRLAAAVDKRIGTKALRSKFGAWNDAKDAFDYWANMLRERLESAKAGKLT